jgi:hypothetical protein
MQSILNSSIFQKQCPQYGTDIQQLCSFLENWARINPELSNAIFEYYNSHEEKIDYAIRNLQDSVASTKRNGGETEWAFESLSTNEEFLDSIGKGHQKRKVMARTVHSTTKKLCKEDEEYCNELVNYFDEEEIHKQAYQQWIRDIGTMGKYAGDSEMLLFVHSFDPHIIVVKNTWDGIHIENTYHYVQLVKDPTNEDLVFPKPSLDNSIFMWAVNPKAPSRPLKPDEYLTQHFLSLDLISEPDPSMENCILTFEQVPWKQGKDKESNDGEKMEEDEQEPGKETNDKEQMDDNEQEPEQMEEDEKEKKKTMTLKKWHSEIKNQLNL